MKIRGLKVGLALACGLWAVSASAATWGAMADKPFADADHVAYSPLRSGAQLPFKSLVTNHGGGSIASPKVVLIFSVRASTTPPLRMLCVRPHAGGLPQPVRLEPGIRGPAGILGSILEPRLGTPDAFDTSAPPTNVTDAKVRAEVTKYLSTHAFNSSTIYQVVIPSTSYSSSGTSTSCGGPSLAYCSYYGTYAAAGGTAFYAIAPYPSCSGCKVTGWTDTQDSELFVGSETCEAATSSWFDATGANIIDKCAWSPPPYILNGYAYRYVWSNKAGRCVQ